MSDRRNFTMDDEAAELLDDHPDDNHSELVRDLLKEYYTAGVYDTEQAALNVRRAEIDRQLKEMQAQMESLQEEREQLDAVVDDDTTTDVEAVAEDISMADPASATADNIAIQKAAKQNGVDAAVLAELVREREEAEERAKFSALS